MRNYRRKVKLTHVVFTCWVPVGLRSVSRDEHGFENKIERITLHGIEQKDQDGKKAKEENTNYTELSWYKMTLISAPW